MLRQAIRNWLGVDERIRDVIRRELAARALPQASEVEALEKRVASLEKKMKMTMGSMQASGAQVMGVTNALDDVRRNTAQALQVATTAKSTAESAADGLEAVEEQIERLKENLAPAS